MIGYLVDLIVFAGLYSLFALGLNLQWGFTGLINFGHVAFMTIGAYATALLSLQGIPIPLAVLIGMAIAAILGLLIGLSTLRLREDYLAIVTIGVSELVRLVALNEEWMTRGTRGVQAYPLPLDIQPNFLLKYGLITILTFLGIYAGWQLSRSLRRQLRESQEIKGKSYQPQKPLTLIIWGIIASAIILLIYITGIISLADYSYKSGLMVLVLLVLAIVYAGLEFLVNSPWGRILKAIREDEEIPRALGKNVFWYKLQALMLGGAIAGIAGAFFAWQLSVVYPDSFKPELTFNAWIIVVLGGAGSNAGILLGAMIFWGYDSLTRFPLKAFIQWLDPLIASSFNGYHITTFFTDARLGALRIMIIGLILMILMVWRPQGILGKKAELTLGR